MRASAFGGVFRLISVLGALFLGMGSGLCQTSRGLVAAVFPPVVKGPDRAHLSLLIQAHAVEYLVLTGRYSDLHVKQILRMAEREQRSKESFAINEQVLAAAERLGAERASFGELVYENGGYRLLVRGARVERPFTVAQNKEQMLPLETLDAVRTGGRMMAEMIARLDGVALPQSAPGITEVHSSAALHDFGECYALLIEQSFRLDSPGLLTGKELATAVSRCGQAVRSDPNFESARAADALVQVLLATGSGGREAAERALSEIERVSTESGYQPFFWMATYWLAARFASPEQGEKVLRRALARHPGSLILHGFLGRHLNQMEQFDAAETAFREYMRLNPRSPYVKGKLSNTLAQKGRHAEAIALAEGAWNADRSNQEAQLELASRYIDANKWQDAISLLSPLTTPQAGAHLPRGEILLRLGYAYQNREPPDLENAKKFLEAAASAASQPAEWKTRARAQLNLARLYLSVKDHAAAKRAMERAHDGAALYVDRYLKQDPSLSKLNASLRPTDEGRPLPALALVATPQAPVDRATLAPLCSKRMGICLDLGVDPSKNRSDRLLDAMPSNANHYRSSKM